MAESAFQTKYRQDHVAAFERRQSLLRDMCTKETEIRGSAAVFLVAGSGGAVASTRGINGKIPGRGDDLTQQTCTLVEYHDVVDKTGFNIFASQGDQVRIMQESSMAVINRRMDASVIAAAETGTQYAGVASAALTLDKVAHILAILGNANAGGANVAGAISPAAYVDLLQTEEFTNVNYVDKKVFATTNDAVQARFAWAGIEWVVHSGLTVAADFRLRVFLVDARNDISWCRASTFIGAKLLQNTGVVIFRHTGDGYAATA